MSAAWLLGKPSDVDFRAIADADADGITLLDAGLCYRYVNPATERFLDRPAAELLGRGVYDVFPHLRGSRFGDALDAARHDGATVEFVHAATVRPGDVSYQIRIVPFPTAVALVAAPDDGAAGGADAPSGVLVFARDISAQRRAEERLARSEERLRLVLEAADMVPWEWDLSGLDDPARDFVRARVRAGRAFLIGGGGPRAEAIPIHTAADFFARLHPDDLLHVRAALVAALSATPDAPAPYEAEFRMRPHGSGPDAPYAWVAARGHLTHDPETGRPLRLSGVRWEIGQRKRLEEERAEAVRRLAAHAEHQERIAETLQRSLLLVPDIASPPGWEVAPFYEAASDEARVGGDFFDIYPVDPHRTAFVVGDVTGKGLAAATTTAEVKFALRTLLRAHDADPAAALYALNRHLFLERTTLGARGSTGSPLFVCLSLIITDARDHSLRVAIAGGEPPLFLRASGATDPLPAVHGLLLGAWPTWEADGAATPAATAPGDTLLLLTDGITEARPPDAPAFFGPRGAIRAARGPSAEAVGEAILAAARAHSRGALRDDVCLLTLRRTG